MMRLTTIEQENIINEYLNGLSTVKLGNRYNVNPSTIRDVLIKNGIKLRSNKLNSRKYYVNENVFNIIETEEQAYWLGFLYADGYVMSSDNSKKICIALSEKDKGHLNKFIQFMGSNYPIKTYKQTNGYKIGSNYCRVCIISEKIYDDLLRYGVLEHKTHNLKYPDYLPNYLQWHFLRGYCDGDGCITPNGNSYAVKIMCIESFAKSIISFLSENIDDFYYSYKPRKENCMTKSLNLFGKSAYQFIDKAYRNNNISLDRKNALAIKSLEYFSRLYQ